MKTLISFVLCSALVGVYCRPAEPEFRDFGVQPDNPNVKVFFTYPTASPPLRIDNPNDLEKGTKNDEKEKYVKDDLKEESKTKGEVIGKTENEAPIPEKESTSVAEETVVEGDQPPPPLLFVVNPESSDNKDEVSNDENEEDNRPLSKDIASQSSTSDNRLEAALNDTLNGDDDTEFSPDVEINDEEAAEENREIVVNPQHVSEFSDAENDSSPLVGFTVHPASSLFENDQLNTEEAEEMESGPIVIGEASGADSGVALINSGAEMLVPIAETEEEVAPVENEPIMVSELGNEPVVVMTERDEEVPEPIMDPIGEIHSTDPNGVMVEAMPNDNLSNDSTMMQTEVFQLIGEEGHPMRVEAVIPVKTDEGLPIIMEAVVPVETEEVLPMGVEAVVPEETEEDLSMREEAAVPLETEEGLPMRMDEIIPIEEDEFIPMEEDRVLPMADVFPIEAREEAIISPISELPAPIAEFEPLANAPIAEADQAFVMTKEGVEPDIEMAEDFSDYMGPVDDEAMEAKLGVAPQMPDAVLPIVEAEVPLMDETVPAIGEDFSVDSSLDSTVAENKETDDRTPRTEDKIVEDTVTATPEQNLKEVDPVVALLTKETHSENKDNSSIPEETSTDATLTATPLEAEKDTGTVESHKEIALKEEKLGHQEETKLDQEDKLVSSNVNDTLSPETEAPVPVTTPETSVDPIELALQQEDFSDDDTFLNETL